MGRVAEVMCSVIAFGSLVIWGLSAPLPAEAQQAPTASSAPAVDVDTGAATGPILTIPGLADPGAITVPKVAAVHEGGNWQGSLGIARSRLTTLAPPQDGPQLLTLRRVVAYDVVTDQNGASQRVLRLGQYALDPQDVVGVEPEFLPGWAGTDLCRVYLSRDAGGGYVLVCGGFDDIVGLVAAGRGAGVIPGGFVPK